MSLISVAKEYVGRGWNVLPVKNKRPTLASWSKYNSHKQTESDVDNFWNNGASGIAIICGQISGLLVLDIDSKADVNYVCNRYNISIDDYNVVKTGGGGYHFYFKCDKNYKNKVGLLTGVDVRANGGIVVAPPSKHESGATYEWVGGAIPDMLPSIPVTLVKDLLSSPMDDVVPEGTRDDTLTSYAGKLVKQGLDKPDVLAILKAINIANVNPPLDIGQIHKIVNSVWDADKKNHPERHEKKTFRVVSVSELAEEILAVEDSWAIKDWLPDSTCGIVGAMPGMYKTWMLLKLAVSLATGDEFLGQHPTRACKVLLVQQEDHYPTILGRICKIAGVRPFKSTPHGWELDMPPDLSNIIIHPDRELQLDNSASLDALHKSIEQHKPNLVIIDPLYSAAGSEDYMAKAAKHMLSLKKIRDACGTSFLIAHHTTKPKQDNQGSRERDKLWGSIFLNAWMETGWEFTYDSYTSINIHRHFKQESILPVVKVSFEISDTEFKTIVEEGPDVLDDKIMTFILNNKAPSIDAICQALNIPSKATVHRSLQRLKAKKKDGHYIIEE